jgi:hypothetical protein
MFMAQSANGAGEPALFIDGKFASNRDVPPGHYHIAPESFGRDFNQDGNVDLAPGQQLYVKIVSLDSWGVSVSGSKNIARDAFYAWVIPPEVAQAEIARDRSGI